MSSLLIDFSTIIVSQWAVVFFNLACLLGTIIYLFFCFILVNWGKKSLYWSFCLCCLLPTHPFLFHIPATSQSNKFFFPFDNMADNIIYWWWSLPTSLCWFAALVCRRVTFFHFPCLFVCMLYLLSFFFIVFGHRRVSKLASRSFTRILFFVFFFYLVRFSAFSWSLLLR